MLRDSFPVEPVQRTLPIMPARPIHPFDKERFQSSMKKKNSEQGKRKADKKGKYARAVDDPGSNIDVNG